VTAGPGERKAILTELAKMFAAFPAQEQSDIPTSLRMDAYLEAIGLKPAWAVREARLRVIRGETDLSTRFAPTPPQLALEVSAVLRPLQDDLVDLDRLSVAEVYEQDPVPAPEERALVAEGFQRLRADLAVGERERLAERKEFRDELFRKGNEVVARHMAAKK
jgi:hypothetical protein